MVTESVVSIKRRWSDVRYSPCFIDNMSGYFVAITKLKYSSSNQTDVYIFPVANAQASVSRSVGILFRHHKHMAAKTTPVFLLPIQKEKGGQNKS